VKKRIGIKEITNKQKTVV